MTPEAHPLIQAVQTWDRRDRARQTLLWLPRALALALTGGAFVVLLTRVRPLLTDAQALTAALTALVLATAIVLVRIWARRHPLIERARQFDRIFALDEQVSTAVAIDAGQIALPDWWRAQQRANAAAAARSAADRLAQVVPLPFDWRAWLAVVAAGLLQVGLLLLPNPLDAAALDPAQAAAIAAAAGEIGALADITAADPSLSAESRDAALNALRRGAQALDAPDITPERAISQLNETSADLRAEADAAGARADAAQDALRRAADALRAAGQGAARSDGSTPPASAADAAAAAQRSLEELGERAQSMTPEERAAAAEALRSAADALSGSSTPGERSSSGGRAADALRSAADALTEDDPATARQPLEQGVRALQEQARQAQADAASQEPLNRLAEQARRSASEIARAGDPAQGGADAQGERGSPTPGDAGTPGGEGESASSAQDGDSAAPGAAGDMPGEGAGEGVGEPGSRTDGGGAGSDSAGDGDGGAGSTFQSGVSQRGGAGEAANNPDGRGERPFAPINVPRALTLPDGTTAIELSADPGALPALRGDFTDNTAGTISVPYQDVFPVYRGAVDQALDSGSVPLALRDVVRGYFTSLDPGR